MTTARADGADQAALQAQKDQLFQKMLANPADLDVAFDYADVSAQLGDNEGAVSALERMLLFNPNLPRVDLELGALYFRMGSFDIARTYFNKALAANPPPEVQQRVNQYLALIDQQLSPTRLTGTLFFGAQYQSDANVAPATSTIASPIGPVLLNNQFVKMSDWNIFGSGSLLYTYDLGTQDHDTIEVTGNGLMNHYMTVNRLDLAFGEMTAGPRFRYPQFSNGLVQGASLKPYAILNEVGLGYNQYFFTYGAGLEATGTVWDDIALRGAFEFRQRNLPMPRIGQPQSRSTATTRSFPCRRSNRSTPIPRCRPSSTTSTKAPRSTITPTTAMPWRRPITFATWRPTGSPSCRWKRRSLAAGCGRITKRPIRAATPARHCSSRPARATTGAGTSA